MTPRSHRSNRDTEAESEARETPIVVRDRRRIDPVTGQLRPPADVDASAGGSQQSVPLETPAPADQKELEALRSELAERIQDLQRITAEYANHRKRVERERQTIVEQATALVLTSLFPALDDIERARAHGDLTGGFATVADHLLTAVNKLGLTTFGAEGDVFDPTWHEAVSHTGGGESGVAVCAQILRKGYALGDRMLRPALVVVSEGDSYEDTKETSEQE